MILAAQNFRDEEYFEPKAAFEDKNAIVITASTAHEVTGTLGARVTTDFLLSEVSAEEFDAIFFVGGSGCLEYINDNKAKELAEFFSKAKKGIGAICAAPRLLLHWGLLNGKKMTGWNGDHILEALSKQNGAIYTGNEVQVDGLFLTANGPEVARKAGEVFLKLLQNKNK